MAPRPTRQAQQANITHEDGSVIIDLDVAYLQVTPASARTMAALLVKHAARVEGKTGLQTVIVDMGGDS